VAREIEIKGPAKYLVVGVVATLFLSNWLVPDLVAGVIGKGGRSWRLLRSGHLEGYFHNPTGHWLTAETGSTNTGIFFAFAGERVVIDYGMTSREGSVGVYLAHYDWSILPDYVWTTRLRETQEQVLQIELPATGIYDIRLSYFNFSGDVRVDWSVE
jgi:hypothetical protein